MESLSLAVGNADGDEAECQATQERPLGKRSSLFSVYPETSADEKPEAIVLPSVKTLVFTLAIPSLSVYLAVASLLARLQLAYHATWPVQTFLHLPLNPA